MHIIKHGKNVKVDCTEDFKCKECECEFTAEKDEYYVDFGGGDYSGSTITLGYTYTWKTTTTDIYVCSCPECRKIVKKKKIRNIEVPSCTAYSSTGVCINSNGTEGEDHD